MSHRSSRLRGLVLIVPLLAVTGCAIEKRVSFEPASDAAHVTGTLTKKDDQRPVDGPMWLTVALEAGQEERVMIPSLFTGQPPTTVTLALQQKVDQLKVGDHLTATGTRNSEGILAAERIDILER